MQVIKRVQKMSTRVAWTGLAAGVLFILCVVDTVVSGFLTPKNFFPAVAGSSQWINGTLPSPVQDISALDYRIDTPRIKLVFKQIQGRLWRGILEVAPETSVGEHSLEIFVPDTRSDAVMSSYQVRIFETRETLWQSYSSVIQRHLGIAPMYFIPIPLSLVVACLAASYRLSSRMESYLAKMGIVPISKMAKNKAGWEIQFGLGRSNGIQQNDQLILLNASFAPVGDVTVSQVQDCYGTAIVPQELPITPSCWITRRREAPLPIHRGL